MSLFKLNLTPFFETEGGGPAAPVDGPDKDQSLRAFLEDGDDDEEALELPARTPKKEALPEDTESEDESESEVEDTLEDSLEEDLASPPEDKLEYVEPVRRRELLEYDKNLFKKFPYLEHAIYREQAYTQVFASPKDATEAAEKAQALDNFESTLLSGDTATLFQSIKESDPNGFNKVVDNLLLNIGKVDEGAQIHIITNVARHLVQRMVEESENSGQEVLKHAAIILNQFATGSSKFTPPQPLAQSDKPKDDGLDKERKEFQTQRFETTRNEVIGTLDRKINATLNKQLDPNNSLTDFTRKAASAEVKRELQRVIGADTRFQNVMKQAWAKAVKSNFAKGDIDLIQRSYEQKAAGILPNIIKKVRSEALKGLGKRERTDEEVEIREPKKRGPVAPGRSAAPNSGNPSARSNMKAPPKGMSVKSFLMSDE